MIEETFESRRVLSRALALQWFGQHIFPKNWSDCWITVGLAYYMAGLFLRKQFGMNDFRFRLRQVPC
jgi:transcription initiation factor TFIID subunit 2